MPHLAQACILVTPPWALGCLGGGDAPICTGCGDWLAHIALGSRSLGILLPVPLRGGQRIWDPCFQQKQMTK